MEENNLANTTTQEINLVDSLALQARALVMNVNMNMWQLARVLVEAKRLVPHGEWGNWLEKNADMSERSAQNLMKAYNDFGGIPQIEGLGKSKILSLLPLPKGTVVDFLESNDVDNMTSREIADAVKKVRAEADAEIQKERHAREEAERRADFAEKHKNQPTAELKSELSSNRTRIAQQEAEIDRLTKAGEIAAGEAERLRRENREQAELLTEQQEELNRTQRELLDMQSSEARGEVERIVTDQLTLDTFAQAVNGFIGTCSRLPLMRYAFAAMDDAEIREYRTLLETVEKWARDSRNAMELNVVDMGGFDNV